MRTNCILVVTLLGTLSATLIGCASRTPQEPVYAEVPPPSTVVTNAAPAAAVADPEPAAAATAPDAGTASPLIVTPDDTLEGSVVSVNDTGRFAVLKFPVGRLPAKESSLIVYRQGVKVGELKVSGPQKDDHIVADIREGDCRVADVVRNR